VGEQLQFPEVPTNSSGEQRPGPGLADAPAARRQTAPASTRRPAAELLATPGALLTRSHLRELGLERRAVDAVFRALPVVALPGYSRPMIRAEEYQELIARSTYNGDSVRP